MYSNESTVFLLSKPFNPTPSQRLPSEGIFFRAFRWRSIRCHGQRELGAILQEENGACDPATKNHQRLRAGMKLVNKI